MSSFPTCAFFCIPDSVGCLERALASITAGRGTGDAGALLAVEGAFLPRAALLSFRRPETLAGIVVVCSKRSVKGDSLMLS